MISNKKIQTVVFIIYFPHSNCKKTFVLLLIIAYNKPGYKRKDTGVYFIGNKLNGTELVFTRNKLNKLQLDISC